MLNYIAILGFAHCCPKPNRQVALAVGKKIACEGFGIAAGNIIGTPFYAFQGAKQVDGHTMAIIDHSTHLFRLQNSDILKIVKDQNSKHHMLSNCCIGAVVMGGGPRTLKLIDQFLSLSKPVIALSNSGGVTEQELRQRKYQHKLEFHKNIETAINKQVRFWKASSSG